MPFLEKFMEKIAIEKVILPRAGMSYILPQRKFLYPKVKECWPFWGRIQTVIPSDTP